MSNIVIFEYKHIKTSLVLSTCYQLYTLLTRFAVPTLGLGPLLWGRYHSKLVGLPLWNRQVAKSLFGATKGALRLATILYFFKTCLWVLKPFQSAHGTEVSKTNFIYFVNPSKTHASISWYFRIIGSKHEHVST